MALGHEIYDYDPSARLSVRDDRESSCTNLTELSEKDGECPVDAARITESQRDPHTLSRQRKSPTRFFGVICRIRIRISFHRALRSI